MVSVEPKPTFEGEGFKEELPNGNEEESTCEEKGSQEKEALTTAAGPQASLIFLTVWLGLRDFVPGAFCWTPGPTSATRLFGVVVRVRRKRCPAGREIADGAG
jgi:hypothetical protein